MRIRQPGKIRNWLWFLGREESCVYLLQGKHTSMIVSGGMSYIVPDLLHQFDKCKIDDTSITKLLILHAHFDHIGIVPFLKNRFPDLEIYASVKAWEILQDPEKIDIMNRLNRTFAERIGLREAINKYCKEWSLEIGGHSITQGDRIDLGNLQVDIHETPGHSSCSISAYSPQIKTLFPSDAGGIPYKDMIIPVGNSNFVEYLRSLKKLEKLDVDYICADHYGIIAGNEAKNYIKKSLEVSDRRFEMIKDAYLRTHDIEGVARRMVKEFYAKNPDYFLPAVIAEGNYRRMIMSIANMVKMCPEY